MKQKRIFCKRLLTMILCLAMIFTSVNLPANTLTAEAALQGVLVEASGANVRVTLPGNYSSYNIYINDVNVQENAAPAAYSFAQTATGEYTVKVVAVVDGEESTEEDAIYEQTVTIASLTPATPVGLVINEVSGTPGTISLAWAADSAVDHYIVKYGGTTIESNMTNGGTIAGFANGTYELSLIAVASNGDESEACKASVTVANGLSDEAAVYKPSGTEGGDEGDTGTTDPEPSGDHKVATADDKAELTTAYEEAQTIVEAGKNNYTTASWNAFTAAVTAAKEVLDSDTATVGQVKAALAELKRTKEGLTENTSETTNVVVSEQLNQAKVNENITLTYVADRDGFTFGDDYTLKINGNEVSDKTGIVITDTSITLPAGLNTAAGVAKIEFGKEGCIFTPVYQTVYAADTTDEWNLVWNDEFEGTSLDMTKWDYQTGNGSAYGIAGWGNQEEEYYTDSAENSSVGDGTLTITAKKDSSYAGSNYTSARLRTVTEDIVGGKAGKGTALQAAAYGKIEAKMKMPAGDGIWPAFWMLPYDSEYGTWATSGELDIMEARGRMPNTVCGTIHYGDVWPNNSHDGEDYYFDEGESFEQYHIYSVEWDPTEIRWLVDGEVYGRKSNWYSVAGEEGNWPYPAPFDEEFYVILNLAVGGTFDTSVSSDAIQVDADGVSMDVDYVRWYQRDPEVYENWDMTEPDAKKDESEAAKALLATADANGNFIKDGDFTAMNTTPYTTNGSWDITTGYWAALLIPENGGGQATWSKVDNDGTNYLKVSVTNAGSQTYSSQMLQYFPVVEGYSYEISYMAYTDTVSTKADVSLKIGGDDDNSWGVYSGNYTDELTTTPTKYSHKFTMTGATDPTARFEFNLATSTGNVYLSDVAVKLTAINETDGEDDPKNPLSDGNHVYNGEFNIGTDSLLYWHWSGNDDASIVKSGKDAAGNRVADITVAGDPVSIWQMGMNLLQSDQYKLTFNANTTEAQTITIAVTNADGTETYATTTKELTAGDNAVDYTFAQPEGKTDTAARLMITFAKSAQLDGVKLIRTSNNNIDWDAMDVWPIYNGDFFNGKDGWNIWHEGVGYQISSVNEDGALSMEVTVGKNGTFYCVGVQSSDMTLTKGIPYRVRFDYTLPSAKNYTLELAGEQREITLEAGTHTYTSEPFTGSGNCNFTLYLGPDETATYNLLLDNIEVYVDTASLTVPEGYAKPVSLAQDGQTKAKSAAKVKYTEDAAWEAAEKTYYIDGEEIDSSNVQLDTANNKISINGSLFETSGTYRFAVKAEGYTRTKAITLVILEESGNLLVNGDFSRGTSSWTFYLADWTSGGSFTVNDDGVAVINHGYDGGEEWHFQLYQTGLEYPAGSYAVTFDAWADVERPIGVQMQNGNTVIDGTASKVLLTTEKQKFTVIWENLPAGAGNQIDFPMGSITYNGVTSPNNGEEPYNIYVDNVNFHELSDADYADMTETIVSPGAATVGEDIVLGFTQEKAAVWRSKSKTVYVNGAAVDASKLTETETGITIDKSVFTEPGLYSIYVIAEGYSATNTVKKSVLGEDGNRILGGDMNDASLWFIYNENAADLSNGTIEGGKFNLDYTAGYYYADWSCWVTWSSQLKKENISVEAGKTYTFRFEASTDLEGGRDIIFEFPGSTQSTKHIDKGTGVYEITITPTETTDEYTINMLLGPVGDNLQIDTQNGDGNNTVPHTLTLDNFSLMEAGSVNKVILASVLEAFADMKDDADFSTIYAEAAAVYNNPQATQADVDGAVVSLRNEYLEVAKAALAALIQQYESLEQNESGDHAYTNETWEAFCKELEAAKKCCDSTTVTADDVAYAKSALAAAAAGLVNETGLRILTIPDQTYTGSAIKPVVEVWDGITKLKEKTDYTVGYKNNTKAGEATVTVTGKGNYAKKDTATFKIVPKNLADEDIVAADVYAIISRTNKVTNPKVTVKYGKKTLSTKNDYEITWPKVTDDNGNPVAGKYTVTITAKKGGNYTGSKTIGYEVRANNTVLMSKVKVKLNVTTVDYDGENTVKPAVTVTYGSGKNMETLTEGTDYKLDYVNYNQVGKATITVSALEGSRYYGTKSVTYAVTGIAFKVNRIDISGIEKSYTYTGSDITVDTLTLKDKQIKVGETEELYTLVEGTDYEVVYSKNKNAGTATMTIKGLGAYTGTIKKTFKINKLALSTYTAADSGLEWASDASAVYTKSGAMAGYTLKFIGEPLIAKTDYTVTYQNNKKVVKGESSATIKITGKGNFSGTITAKFEVTVPEADTLYAVATDVVAPAKASKLKTTVKVYEESTGKALTAGTDYDKKIEYFVMDGEKERAVTDADMKADQMIYARITLKNNYVKAGEAPATVETSFRLYSVKASTFKVDKIDAQIYTGKAIEPEVVVKNKAGELLTEGVDYELTYSNNIKKGTAKVTVTGIGNGYGGTKNVTFKITAADMNWAQKAAQSIADFFSNLF